MTNRKFVPENFNVDNEDEVKALYQSLLDEDVANSPEALRSWILKWSELGSVLSESADTEPPRPRSPRCTSARGRSRRQSIRRFCQQYRSDF